MLVFLFLFWWSKTILNVLDNWSKRFMLGNILLWPSLIILATGSSRAWPTPKDDLSRSVLYLHYVSLSNSILILKRNFKYPGQLVNPIPTGCCHVTLIYRLIPPMAGRNRVKEDDLFRSVLNLHCVSFFLISIHVWDLLQSAIEKRSKTVHHSYHSKVKTTYLPT